MHGLVAALVVLPVLVMQDPTLGQRPAGGGGAAFSGGTITAPILGPAGCTNPAYSFSAQPTWGLCQDAAGVKMQGSSAGKTASFRTVTQAMDPAQAQMVSTNTSTASVDAFGDFSGVRLRHNLTTLIDNRFFVNQSGIYTEFTGTLRLQTPLLLLLQGVVSSTFLSFTNVATPANVITMAQDSSAPSLTTTVTDGTSSGAVILFPNGASIEATVGATAGNISVTPEQVSLTASNATHDVRWHALTGGSGSTGVVIATTGTQPTCNLANHRSHWFVIGGAGVADTYEVCMKDAADVYAWKVLATP